jgi:hypothetical protein
MKRATGKSNISIVKDYLEGNRPFVQVGYTESATKRKEGEIWKSRGQTWTVKNGVKIAINNINTPILDLIKEKCSDCGKNLDLFGERLDKKVYRKTGKCFDCLTKYESELKRRGEYECYEKIKIFSNQKSYCLDMKQKLKETIDYLEKKDDKISFMNEDGSYEYWQDTMKEKILIDAKKDYQECLEALDRIEKQLETLNGAPKSTNS